MDTRGGRITWYLDADDSGFAATNRRVRDEASDTARSVDRDFKKTNRSVSKNMTDFRMQLARSANFVRNFQVATRGFNMTTLGLAVITATGLVLELGSALVTATGALLALPAAGAILIAAFGTMKVASSGLADAFDEILKGDPEKIAEALEKLSPAGRDVALAFQDIHKAFVPIQQAVQQTVFDGIGQEMRNLAAATLPNLQIGMTLVGNAINGMIKEASRVAQEPFFQGMIASTFSSTATATTTLTGAIQPLLKAFSDLVIIGLPFMERFAVWITDVARSAAAFTSSAEGAGKISGAIQAGVDALQLLGGLLKAVGGFFIELFKISNEEGMSMVQTLTDVINKMTEWLQSEEGQRQMQALLRLTNDVFVETLKIIGDVVGIILTLVEALDGAPAPVRDLVIQFLAWTAVLTPIVTYLVALGNSIGTVLFGLKKINQVLGITNILKVVFSKAITLAFKAVMFLGRALFTQLIPALVRTGAAFLIAIGPIGWIVLAIAAVIGAFVWLWNNVDGFREFWIGVWEGIKGAVAGVVDWFTGTVVPFFQTVWQGIKDGVQAFKDFWVEVWTTVKDFVVEVATTIWNKIVEIFTAIWTTITTVLTTIWNTVVDIWSAIWGFLQPILKFFLNLFIIIFGTIFIVIVTTLQNIWNTIVTVFTTVWTFLVTILTIVWNFFVTIFTAIWNTIVTVATLIWNTIVTIFTTIWTFLVTIWTAVWNFIVTVATAIWNTIVTIFTAVWNTVTTVFNAIWNTIVTVFNAVWNTITTVANAIWDTITTVFNAIWNTIVTVANAIWDTVSGAFNRVWETVSSIVESIKTAVTNAFNGAKDAATTAFNGLKNAVSDAIQGAKDKVTEVVDGIKAMFSGAGTWLIESGKAIMQGLADGIGKMAGAVQKKAEEVMKKVRDLMPFSPAKEGPFSGKGWTLYSGQSIVEGLAEGIASSGRMAVQTAAGVVGQIHNSMQGLNGMNFAIDGNVSDFEGTRSAVGSDFGANDNSSHIENHIGQITIANDVDAENWLAKLTRQDEITRSGLTA